jgi:ATP-dependent exoDNAse (exonuclease V) alpha subunit
MGTRSQAGGLRRSGHSRGHRHRQAPLHDEAVILSTTNIGDAGTKAVNTAVRDMLQFPPDKLVIGDILLITKNNRDALSLPLPEPSEDKNGAEPEPEFKTISNGERALVIGVGPDFVDLDFQDGRKVRLLMSAPKSGTLDGQLPKGVSLGYAMSVHKAQGSQFRFVIFLAQRGSQYGTCRKSLVYTGSSRPQEQLFIVGSLSDFAHGAGYPDNDRCTYLSKLLRGY